MDNKIQEIIEKMPICQDGKKAVKSLVEEILRIRFGVPFVLNGLYKTTCIQPHLLVLKECKQKIKFNKEIDTFAFFRLETNELHVYVDKYDFDKIVFEYHIEYLRDNV